MYVTVTRSEILLCGRSQSGKARLARHLMEHSPTTMLILTRKADEHIRIGPDITISVFEIEGNRVKIGIDAPRGVNILRSELEEHPRDAAVEQISRRRAA